MSLEGSTVSEVRQLTDEECREIGIPIDNMGNPFCIVLSSGSILFSASDRAMNSGGGWAGDTHNLKSIEGEQIKSVAPMSDEYMEYLEWQNNVAEKSVVISFTNGRDIYTASDPEGNGAGILFEYDSGQTYEVTFN